MSNESFHRREYRKAKLQAQNKIYSEETRIDPDDLSQLSAHQQRKLRQEKADKVLKYNQESAHTARAHKRRVDRSWSDVHFAKLNMIKLKGEK